MALSIAHASRFSACFIPAGTPRRALLASLRLRTSRCANSMAAAAPAG
jgi:hypothetical protein